MPRESGSSGHVLVDVLDRVLDKGIVIDAAVRISVVGIELLGVDARVVVASIETYLLHADTLAYTDLAAGPRGRPESAAAPPLLAVSGPAADVMPRLPPSAPAADVTPPLPPLYADPSPPVDEPTPASSPDSAAEHDVEPLPGREERNPDVPQPSQEIVEPLDDS